jgi:hypothetical protein
VHINSIITFGSQPAAVELALRIEQTCICRKEIIKVCIIAVPARMDRGQSCVSFALLPVIRSNMGY